MTIVKDLSPNVCLKYSEDVANGVVLFSTMPAYSRIFMAEATAKALRDELNKLYPKEQAPEAAQAGSRKIEFDFRETFGGDFEVVQITTELATNTQVVATTSHYGQAEKIAEALRRVAALDASWK